MIARFQRTQDVAPRDGLSSSRRCNRRTLVITAVRAGDCPLPKINSRTSVDHVVRRSLPEESGRRREKSCQLRSAIVADNRRSVWETALPWEAETIDRRQRELVLTKVGTGIRSSSPEFSAVAFSAMDSARRKSGHPVVQRQRSMFARCQRTQDVAPRDDLPSSRRCNRRTLRFSGAARTTLHFNNVNSRPPLQPMVRRCFGECSESSNSADEQANDAKKQRCRWHPTTECEPKHKANHSRSGHSDSDPRCDVKHRVGTRTACEPIQWRDENKGTKAVEQEFEKHPVPFEKAIDTRVRRLRLR